MSETKEFQGKNLDEAIEAACKHYDLKRDKLEIEIVSGGSTGIFGLVGVKKAVVRAKPRGSFKSAEASPAAEAPERQPRSDRGDRSERPERSEKPERQERAPRPPRPPRREPEPASAEQASAERADAQPGAQPGTPAGEPRRSERGRRGRGRGRGERSAEKPGERQPEPNGNRPPENEPEPNGNRIPDVQAAPPDRDGNRVDSRSDGRGDRAQQPRSRQRTRRDEPRRDDPRRAEPRRDEPRQPRRDHSDDEDSGAPQGIGHLDQVRLEEVAREVTAKLLAPLVENAQISVNLQSDRVSVRIEDPDNTGLLIGREGQTLASIQYLVNRLVSKRMDASVRVQIDAGDYRENQDERLRQIARHLADKAHSTGRTQSTRPMSSYHRRVVHLTLQEDEFVFTRSKGEGSMKRVLIMPKRKGKPDEIYEDAVPDPSLDYSESAKE